MSKFLKKRSVKAGMHPGSLVFVGKRRSNRVKITVFDYDSESYEEKELARVEEAFPYKESKRVSWINIDGLHDTDLIEKLGNHFKFHPLLLEDILNTDQRPKIDIFEDYALVVFNMLSLDEKTGNINSEQVSLILGKNFVLSFREVDGNVFDSIRDWIRHSKGRVRDMGADYLAYAVLDAIVDNYFIVLEKLGDKIEEFEIELMSGPKHSSLRQIYDLKREVAFLRKSVWPLRDVVSRLEKGEFSLVQAKTRIYLRDLYDHVTHVIDTVETFRDMSSGLIDLYMSSMSNRMNEVMKVLTLIATIFIPLTFITGIYGMNFDYMPELSWPLGYYLALGIMLFVGVGMLWFFHRKKWI